MIEVENLTKSFGSILAVDRISFSLKPGEVVGFLGPNGAGKTTTMRMITGFLPPTSGACTVCNLDVATHSFEIRKKIGYLPESASLYQDMEAVEYLCYLGNIRHLSHSALRQGLKEVIETCGLEKVVGRKIGSLSKGYRQRVGLAQALLHKPDVLILDEPTVGLDPNQIGEIQQLIKNLGQARTVLLSTHILGEVEQTCQRVIIISDGKIVGQGTPRELVAQTEGAVIYHVGLRAKSDDLEDGFKKLPGYISFTQMKSVDGLSFGALKMQAGQEGGEEIFKLAVSQGWVLTELKKEEINLEGVFKKLTQEEK